MRPILIITFLLLLSTAYAQQTNNSPDSSKQQYLAELKIAGRTFTRYLYPNYTTIYSSPEKTFIAKIDSVRKVFNDVLNRYSDSLAPAYVSGQQTEIKYYFDKLLIEYPSAHDIYIGGTQKIPYTIPARLKGNIADINKPALLPNDDVQNYTRAFLSYLVTAERTKPAYKKSSNRELDAVWKLIPQYITNPVCRTYWQYDQLYYHIDNNGIKGIEKIYKDFKTTCKDAVMLNKVTAYYSEDSAGRQGHLIKTYKTVGPFNLDIHMFLPDSIMTGDKRPVIVYFHGGSWSEGKPDWFFSACDVYAKKGWVACAVEYRTFGRHGTLPFDAVKDARSAIRWLRQHANEYNIDTNRIVASGNSAGGHLVLCTALADDMNEGTDDLRFSPTPNALMVNAGVYDLTDMNTAWIRKDLKDKSLVQKISPNFLARKNLPPTIILHGTEDRNVPFATAKQFADEMAKAGNTTVEFHPINGAAHFIWLDMKYSSEVSKLRSDFLTKLGY